MPLQSKLASIAFVSAVLAGAGAPAAYAQYRSAPFPPYDTETTTRSPERGFSGFVRFGHRNYWCDYQRIPNRTCTRDRAGRERCKVTSWTLKQYCY